MNRNITKYTRSNKIEKNWEKALKLKQKKRNIELGEREEHNAEKKKAMNVTTDSPDKKL